MTNALSCLLAPWAGGVLTLHTRPPSRDGAREEATLVAGGFGLRRIQSVTSGRAGATGFLLSASSVDMQGFRRDPTRTGSTYGSSSRKVLNGHADREMGPGTLSAVVNVLTLDAENPGSLSRALLEKGDRQAYVFNVRQGAGKEVFQAQGGLAWNGSWRGARGSGAVYGIRREVSNPIPSAIVELDRGAGGLRAQLSGTLQRLSWRLGWSVGVEAEGQWDRRKNFENQEGIPGSPTLDQDETVLATGVFALGVLETERLHLLGGLRGDRLSFRVSDRFVLGEDPDDSGRREMGAQSPALGLWARLTPWLAARGSVTTFFQSPTTSELANEPSGAGGFNAALDPVRGGPWKGGSRVGWETGSRWRGWSSSPT